ncbi:MAG TPA: N-acetylmuramoyl-L-alanine amidase [Anaerolineae bacterium]|nr:N-acetylmuramoyl-L-alanine amidase [Anaerolineae bacterium]
MNNERRNSNRDRPLWLLLIGQNISILLFLVTATALLLWVHARFTPAKGQAEVVMATSSMLNRSASIFKIVPARPVRQRLSQSPPPVRIGLIVGHLNNDPGAVCEDGLKEVQVNLNIVERTAALLSEAGVTTEVLAEFDTRLAGYDGTALISVHADSCEDYGDAASGYKTAASSYSDSTHLNECILKAYEAVTGLSYHANTVTPHMTDYHAFRKIDPGTPAVILETGFMNRDRTLLTARADIPAKGLSQGILCYLDAVQR